jgi:sodium-coupled neutral amino acid transporter 11
LCISFFTLFVSYPLSLYRDISKLAKTSALALIAIIVIIVSVVIEGPQQSTEIRGSDELMFNVINDEVFQAIAVISFGNLLNSGLLYICG